jgi:hypothetical protein
MKTVIAAAVCSVASLAFVGCQSKSSDDVKTTYRSQYTSVAADVKTTTDAARAVLESEQLVGVTATSTSVDGKAMGKKADGTEINVYVDKDGNLSKVRVTVGLMGDPSLGTPIADKIKARAEGMKMDAAKMP